MCALGSGESSDQNFPMHRLDAPPLCGLQASISCHIACGPLVGGMQREDDRVGCYLVDWLSEVLREECRQGHTVRACGQGAVRRLGDLRALVKNMDQDPWKVPYHLGKPLPAGGDVPTGAAQCAPAGDMVDFKFAPTHWHYGWRSNKHTNQSEHCLQLLIHLQRIRKLAFP